VLAQIDADGCDVHGNDPPDVNCRVTPELRGASKSRWSRWPITTMM